jgi:hypothetical protein
MQRLLPRPRPQHRRPSHSFISFFSLISFSAAVSRLYPSGPFFSAHATLRLFIRPHCCLFVHYFSPFISCVFLVAFPLHLFWLLHSIFALSWDNHSFFSLCKTRCNHSFLPISSSPTRHRLGHSIVEDSTLNRSSHDDKPPE